MDFEERYHSELENLKDDMIKSISEIVSIPSIFEEGKGDLPFGEKIDKVLRKTLEICNKLGFKTVYGKGGCYGYAETGEGKEMLGILCHLDVVPAGNINAWRYDPFSPTIADGKIYGRGTQDDKGPTMLCIYALKALLNAGFIPKKRIRFIFGVDEERLWRDMPMYKANEELPNIAFVPDSNFPLINAEKGLLQFILKGNNHSDLELHLGNAFNAIPDIAEYNGNKAEKAYEKLQEMGAEAKLIEDKLTVYGKGAHASKPEDGINAITRLCIALDYAGINSNAVKFLSEVINTTNNAENIFKKKIQDDVSGSLTFNVGKLDIENGLEEISVDVRMPVKVDKDYIVMTIKNKAAEYELSYSEYDFIDKLYVSSDHFLVRTLRKVYEQETGYDSTPQSSGGATFARAFENCVAFGPNLPIDGKNHYIKVEHQANEYVDIDNLMKCGRIYAAAICSLTK